MSTFLGAVFSWSTLWVFLLIIYIVVCFGVIAIVLMQKGKGSGFAGAFGAGDGSGAIFGPRGGKSLPQRITIVLGGLFLGIALIMSLISGNANQGVAPAKVETAAPTGLEDLGLGTATGDSPAVEVPAAAPIVETPAADAPAVETPAPAVVTEPAPAVSESSPAPAPPAP